MKLPDQYPGVMRKYHRERTTVPRLPKRPAGVVPQDLSCEESCHDAYAIGSDEHEECLDWCRED
jgi:hypothetical protein